MPGPVIKTPQLPGWADPETASVFDPLHETLIKRAVGVLGIDDPMTALTAPMAPMMAAGKLEPFLIQMYKQRLKADPSLAYHPGLHQVPEFQEAFKVLYPNKTFTTGTPAKSLSKRMQEAPAPPAVRSAEGVDPIEVAKAHITTYSPPKPPKTVTVKEMRVSGGERAQGKQGNPGPSKYRYTKESIKAKAAEWKGSRLALSKELGIPESTLRNILGKPSK